MNDADRREKKRKDKALERELERILQEQDRKKAQDDAKSKPSGNITTRRRRVSFRENPDIRQLPDDDEIPDVGPSGAPIPHPSGRENDDEDPRNLPDRRYSQTLAVEEAMFIGAGASVNSVNWSKTENHYHHSREQYTQGDPEAGQQPETALHAVVWRTLSGFWWLGRMVGGSLIPVGLCLLTESTEIGLDIAQCEAMTMYIPACGPPSLPVPNLTDHQLDRLKK